MLLVEWGMRDTTKFSTWKHPSPCPSAGGPTMTVGDGRAVADALAVMLELAGGEEEEEFCPNATDKAKAKETRLRLNGAILEDRSK